jgi:hypothetical protein
MSWNRWKNRLYDEMNTKGLRMSKMSEIGITLLEYEENLHAFGRLDPLVQILKKELK